MADEPIAFNFKPTRDDLRAHLNEGEADGVGRATFACVRCGTPGARLIAVPDIAFCRKCGVVEAARALGK